MLKLCKILSVILILIKFSSSSSNTADITSQVFDSIDDAVPAAYGDFNSDEFTDVFVLRDNFKTIDILLASAENEIPLLRQNKYLRCHYPELKITSVVPGDFDGDAFMDVMFTAKLDEKGKVGVYVNYGESDRINCTHNDSKPLITMLGEPLAMDFNDDMIIDLFGADEEGNRAVWVFQKGARGGAPRKELLKSDEHLGDLKIPHSHSVLDLNDDGLPDLVLTSEKGFEVWYANDSLEERFQFDHLIENPTDKAHYGQAVFMDLELNGQLHQLMPVCKNEDCSDSSICVVSFGHCHDLMINFKQDNNNTEWGFLTPKHSHDYDHQQDFFRRIISLRVGDFNNDGFPDLLATLEKKNGKSSVIGWITGTNEGPIIQTFLLENVPIANLRDTDKIRRTFEVRWTALAPFGENTVMGSFYDFYQDGIVDVILLQKNGTRYRPLAFRNTLDYDANFVKVIVLTGLFNQRPPAKQTPFGGRKRSYGTNLPGPKIKYQTTTQEGIEQRGASTQLPQSAYFSLHLPYTCFGLSRTPNFVDFVKISLAGHTREWTQLIPNSQMFVIPIDAKVPSTWKAQLFVTPSKLIIRSVIALLGICVLILFIILFLHIKERREDKLEKLQEAQRFHFDAM